MGIGILIQLRDQRIFERQYPWISLLPAKVSNFRKMSSRKYCNTTVPINIWKTMYYIFIRRLSAAEQKIMNLIFCLTLLNTNKPHVS